MPPIEVGPLSSFSEGKPRIVSLQGRELAIVRWRERMFALRNICPHQTTSFEAGRVRGRLASHKVGEVSVDNDCPLLICPWHAWGFRLDNGHCDVDPSLRVKSYDVLVEDGVVFVDMPSS
jgi:nitrite reductase/ring-hydroxylating ferredoxin subunit